MIGGYYADKRVYRNLLSDLMEIFGDLCFTLDLRSVIWVRPAETEIPLIDTWR